MRNSFAKALLAEARNDPRIILVTGDLGYGILDEFQRELPKQFMNVGIAEQSMMSLAAGLAGEGFRPFVYSIANFSTFRCLEQIRNDVSYMNNPVTIISVGAGLGYGSHGYSHHAIEDIAIIRALGNVEIYSPGDPDETVNCLRKILNSSSPAYLRLGKGGESNFQSLENSESLDSPRVLINSPDRSAILSTGSIGALAIKALESIEEAGSSTNIVSVRNLNRREIGIFLMEQNFEFVLTLEEHVFPGGFGSQILEIVNDLGLKTQISRMALRTDLHDQVGSSSYLLSKHKITSANISSQFLKQRKLSH